MVYEDINDIIGSPIEFDEYKKMVFYIKSFIY